MVAEDRASELEPAAARTRGERAVCGPAATQDGVIGRISGGRQPRERRDDGPSRKSRLKHPALVAQDVPACNRAVAGDAGLVGHVVRRQLVLPSLTRRGCSDQDASAGPAWSKPSRGLCVTRMTCVNISEEANGMTDRMVASLNATRGAKVGPCQKVRSTLLEPDHRTIYDRGDHTRRAARTRRQSPVLIRWPALMRVGCSPAPAAAFGLIVHPIMDWAESTP